MSSGPIAPSAWALQRFGSTAHALVDAVAAAVQQAHALALDAHLASTLTSNDAYGYTLRVTLHEQLVEFTSDIPGVVGRKPTGVRSRFPYVVVEETAVVLLPWRYASDISVRRQDARLSAPISDLRKTMLTLSAQAGHVQPTLEEVDVDDVELEALIAEERDLQDQLRRQGAVVTVAFASNPTNGVVGLGWGDAELTDTDSGEVTWHHWEALSVATDMARPARPVLMAAPASSAGAARFDAAPLDDSFGLSIRVPLEAEPVSDATTDEATRTGNDTDEGR